MQKSEAKRKAKTGNTFPQYMALLLPKKEHSEKANSPEKPLCMSLMKIQALSEEEFHISSVRLK